MAGLRRSARLQSSQSSSPPSQPSTAKSAAGTKRKPDPGASPTAKRGKKSAGKEQKTLEETFDESNSAPTAAKKDEAQLAEAIEKSKTETNQNVQDVQNGDLKSVQKDENNSKDTEMVDAPAPALAPKANGEAASEELSKGVSETEKVMSEHHPKSEPAKEEHLQAEPPIAEPPKAEPATKAAQVDEPMKDQTSHQIPAKESNPHPVPPNTEPAHPNVGDVAPVVIGIAKPKPTEEHHGTIPGEPSDQGNGSSPKARTNEGTFEPKNTSSEEAERQEEMRSEQHTNGDTAVEPKAREDEVPASILEKGILYFFFRGRIGIENPQDVNDIARTYMIMRPLPHGAKLGEGPIGDSSNCRLLALPKKTLPLSGKDRFLTFVEKAKTSFHELKREVMPSSDYETQSAGTRHSPAMTPVGEAVYAITTTGRESHLAYILTIPSELSQVQEDIGLRERGSFIVSAKNPQYSSPANAGLAHGAEYPKEILDEFRSLRWMPLKPKLLDYANTQFLVIGESSGLDHATEVQPRDEEQNKDTPLEEMEKLEGEDEIRVKHLKVDDAIFVDLDLSRKEYPKIPSTW